MRAEAAPIAPASCRSACCTMAASAACASSRRRPSRSPAAPRHLGRDLADEAVHQPPQVAEMVALPRQMRALRPCAEHVDELHRLAASIIDCVVISETPM
ncbi:MAG: hypothetical protein R3D62_09865 [Xanthobacteraceae bacterium]